MGASTLNVGSIFSPDIGVSCFILESSHLSFHHGLVEQLWFPRKTESDTASDLYFGKPES